MTNSICRFCKEEIFHSFLLYKWLRASDEEDFCKTSPTGWHRPKDAVRI